MTQGLVKGPVRFAPSLWAWWTAKGMSYNFGTLPQYVPDLVMELLGWVQTSKVHMLILRCMFHYELELIHPFADGKERVGYLWHTPLLSTWNPAFA